ncbi:hypothetical protein Scep_011642 [Stephania cephalantha]|uniref:Uncharacterized protein n=1 Tax=Stephania cephalantha TaxID=152367 RepID=A0AAP0P6P5_9MAGN
MSTSPRKGFSVHVDPRGPENRDIGREIAHSQKALSRTPSSSSESNARESLRRFRFLVEGGSDPWRETPGGRKKEATWFGFDGGGAYARRDGGEEVRRAHRSKDRRLSAAQRQRTWRHFRGGGTWRKNNARRARRRRDLRRRRRRNAEAARESGEWSGRRR